MPAFPLRATAARVAVSLTLMLLPGPVFGQDMPAPLAEPAAVPAADWQPVSRFGLGFAIPPGALVTDDLEGPDLSAYAVSTMGNGMIGSRLGLRLLTPLDMIDAPAPGSPGFTDFLIGLGRVPVAPTGAVLELGGRQMLVYAGRGPIPATGGETREAQMLFLVSQQPDAHGDHLLIAVFSAGLSAAVAGELEARFVTSLRAAGPEAEGNEAAGNQMTGEAPADRLPAGDASLPDPAADEAVSDVPAGVMAGVMAGAPEGGEDAGAGDTGTALAGPAAARPAASPEARAWQAAQAQGTEAAVLGYLAQFPRGLHSGEARRWLRARDVSPPDERRPAPLPADVPGQTPLDPDADAWAQALAEGTAQAFWTYLKAWQNGAHVNEAFARLSFLPGPGTPPAEPMPDPVPGRPDPRPGK